MSSRSWIQLERLVAMGQVIVPEEPPTRGGGAGQTWFVIRGRVRGCAQPIACNRNCSLVAAWLWEEGARRPNNCFLANCTELLSRHFSWRRIFFVSSTRPLHVSHPKPTKPPGRNFCATLVTADIHMVAHGPHLTSCVVFIVRGGAGCLLSFLSFHPPAKRHLVHQCLQCSHLLWNN